MTQLANNFEGGTAGVTLTSGAGGNTGGASGDPFSVNKNAAAICDFSTNAYEGSLAVRMALRAAGTSGVQVLWASGDGRAALTDDYLRFFLYADDVTQGGVGHPLVLWFSGVSNMGGLYLGNGYLYITNQSAGGLSTSFRYAVTASKWYRVEVHHHADTATGSINLRVYNTPASSTADYDVTRGTLAMVAATTNQVKFGNADSLGTNWPSATGYIYLDGIVDAAATWVGPIAGGSPLTTLSAVGAIATGVTFGTARLPRLLRRGGSIASSEAFGRPTATKLVPGVTIVSGAGAIASREAFGNYYGTAVYGKATYGSNKISVSRSGIYTIRGVGAIASREAFGTPTKSPQVIRGQGITSAQAFGTPVLIGAGAYPAIFGHTNLSDTTPFAATASDTTPFAAAASDTTPFAETLDDAAPFAERLGDALVYAGTEDDTQ